MTTKRTIALFIAALLCLSALGGCESPTASQPETTAESSAAIGAGRTALSCNDGSVVYINPTGSLCRYQPGDNSISVLADEVYSGPLSQDGGYIYFIQALALSRIDDAGNIEAVDCRFDEVWTVYGGVIHGSLDRSYVRQTVGESDFETVCALPEHATAPTFCVDGVFYGQAREEDGSLYTYAVPDTGGEPLPPGITGGDSDYFYGTAGGSNEVTLYRLSRSDNTSENISSEDVAPIASDFELIAAANGTVYWSARTEEGYHGIFEGTGEDAKLILERFRPTYETLYDSRVQVLDGYVFFHTIYEHTADATAVRLSLSADAVVYTYLYDIAAGQMILLEDTSSTGAM